MAVTRWAGVRVSGTATNTTFSNWKGISTMRGPRAENKTSKPASESQSVIRDNFSMLGKIGKAINEVWLKKYFGKVKKMTAYNYFLKANGAMIANSSAVATDVQFPQSYLGVPLSFTEAPSLSANVVSIPLPAPTPLSLGTPTEYLIVALLEKKITVITSGVETEKYDYIAIANKVDAAAGTQTLTLPATPATGDRLTVFFQAGDGKNTNYSTSASIAVA